MPISQYDYNTREKNPVILGIQDYNGVDVIKVKSNGQIEIDDTKANLDEAAAEFWQSIVDFFPADGQENVQNKLVLIKTFAKLREMVESSKVNNDSVQDLVEELKEHFYYST
jgi:hypothetical protein